MSKHTSAPWRIRGNEIGKRIESDDQSHGMLALIATVDAYDLPDNVEANKSLICAAPALLEALEELLHGTFPDGVDDDGSGRIGFSDSCVKRYNKAKAAISAARGTV